MNKNKKIAMAVVSTVMAGTFAFSLAGCNPSTPDEGFKPSTGADNYGILNEDGSINYESYKRDSEVTLTLAIGHNSATTSTAFGNDMGAQLKLPDGKTYAANAMKPAWRQMGEDLNITWNDVYTGTSTSGNLEKIVGLDTDATAKGSYSKVDMFTTDLSKAVEYAAKGTDILNLGDYLDYMPNFKMFLESNPVVYLSLLQAGMNTATGEGKTLYVAPYFDGYDDIERYCILRQDWVKTLLDGDTTLTEAGTALGVAPKVQSYMGSTNLTIDTTSSDGNSVTKIVKNYTAALAEAKDTTKPLGKAYNAIAGEAYNGTSGNIVDIMNAALTKNANATGAQLVDLFRAYIDVCYTNENGTKHYAKRSDLFNGYDACWDVDDLVAMLRCIKTNAATVNPGRSVVGIVPRDSSNDRTPDMVRLACQLYGVRGADSRYEYSYIDNAGTLHDARNDKEFFEAFDKLNLFIQEGLLIDYSGSASYAQGTMKDGTTDAFFMYDYVQTQTLNGFYAEDDNMSGTTVQKGYYFAPVSTPVSKWDVDGDGNHTDIMRFTESWRSTKTGGLSLNGSLKNNEAKLKAALQFVDYLYSMDGQIVSTFGPQAKNANGEDGFWYDPQATAEEVAAGRYYTYKGVKYHGYENKGSYWPTITDALYQSFKGLSNAGYLDIKGSAYNISGAKLSFTNYARMLIGSTLPVGVKSQAFETQLTSLMGQEGAKKVGKALDNGTIKGMNVKIDSKNWWYTCVPSGLPIENDITTNVLNAPAQSKLKYVTGTLKDSKNKSVYSIFNWIILKGGNNINYSQQSETVTAANLTELLDYITKNTTNGGLGAATRQSAMAYGWTTSKGYWDSISKG